MAHVAAEMEREGFDIPLLIGGATTSRVHTAVKIHPRYSARPTVYVNDASRAVGVVGALLSPQTRESYVETDPRRISQGRGRASRAANSTRARLPLASGPRQRDEDRLERLSRRRGRSFLGARVIEVVRSRRARALHRLDAVLPDLGAEGPLSRDPRGRGAGRGRARAVRRRAGDAEAHHRGKMVRARRRSSASGRPSAEGDDIELFEDEQRARARSRLSSRCASS